MNNNNDRSAGSETGLANPMLSVIMATYNRERFIATALESILRQPYAPLEVIVVDDGSTDSIWGVVNRFIESRTIPIHYVRQPNSGSPAAHNHGLRLAKGSIIAFLDSDDLWPADRLPAQMGFFEPDPKADSGAPGIVLGRTQRFADGVSVDSRQLATANERPVHYSLGSSLFARWVFGAVGQFDESLLHCADWDWFVRAKEAGVPMAADPRVTLRIRIHGDNMTQDRSIGARFTAQMVRKHLARKRGQE